MSNIHPVQPKRLGILGGGQLARMLVESALPLGIDFGVLAKPGDSSCKFLNPISGDLNDYETVLQFGRQFDILTFEFEDINLDALSTLQNEGIVNAPSLDIMALAKDKGKQREYFLNQGYPIPKYILLDQVDATSANFIAQHIGFPAIQKTRCAGYDGKGVYALNKEEDLKTPLLGPSVVEEKISIEYEMSVIACGNGQEFKTYPPVYLKFKSNSHVLSHLTTILNDDQKKLGKQATALALDLANKLKLRGILAIEFFVDSQGKLYINEIAPRPHNSGHHTIEANFTSQYRQLLLGAFGEKLGVTDAIGPAAMVNLIGDYNLKRLFTKTNSLGGVYLHWYQKTPRPGRKTGHITVFSSTEKETTALLNHIITLEKECRI